MGYQYVVTKGTGNVNMEEGTQSAEKCAWCK